MNYLMNKKIYKQIIAISFVFIILLSSSVSFAAKKEKFDSWQAVGLRMSEVFNQAIEFVKNDEMDKAYDEINKAYFTYYESQGFESTVMNAISRDRVGHIEAFFRDTKYMLKGKKEASKQEIIEYIEALKVKVYRDAMVLDGVVPKNSLDSVGEAVYGDAEVPARFMSEKDLKNENEKVELKAESSNTEKKQNTPIIQKVDQKTKNHTTFVTSFTLLLREGLEAILVIVAIITYLIKTGNKNMCKSVYKGIAFAILASVVLAVAIEMFVQNSGMARELIEGWTMFLAVAVLFYVSNWILSKSSAEKWDSYIKEKVADSVDKKSQRTLVFAAFLAVFREGAELILFFKASFSSAQNNPVYILYGLLVATLCLIVIYVLFRYTTVKLPLRPFFIFTSVLLFLMCISFMGKGVVELTEANVILGSTTIPALNGLHIPDLNIYNRAETLIPQLMLVIASAWLLIKHTLVEKSKEKK